MEQLVNDEEREQLEQLADELEERGTSYYSTAREYEAGTRNGYRHAARKLRELVERLTGG